MSDIAISLPDPMKEYVDAQVASGAYSSAADFFMYLLCEDQKRRAKEYLKKAVEIAEASGEPEEVTADYWNGVRKSFREKYGHLS